MPLFKQLCMLQCPLFKSTSDLNQKLYGDEDQDPNVPNFHRVQLFNWLINRFAGDASSDIVAEMATKNDKTYSTICHGVAQTLNLMGFSKVEPAFIAKSVFQSEREI